jgi:hypothetical protein
MKRYPGHVACGVKAFGGSMREFQLSINKLGARMIL